MRAPKKSHAAGIAERMNSIKPETVSVPAMARPTLPAIDTKTSNLRRPSLSEMVSERTEKERVVRDGGSFRIPTPS